MSKSHFRKIFGDVRARKGRTFLAVLSIFVGVFGVVSLFTTNDLIDSAVREGIDTEAWPTQFVFTGLLNPTNVDNQATLDTIEAVDGVVTAEGRLTQSILWRLESDEFLRDATIEATGSAIDEALLMPVRLIDGVFPITGENQIAVERTMSETHDISVGDSIIVQTLGSGSAVEETWTVTGIIQQTYPDFFNQNPAPDYEYTTFEDAQYVSGVRGFSAILVRHEDFATAEANPDVVPNTINRDTPYRSFFDIIDDPENNLMFEGMSSFISIIAALALTSMVVAGFLVVNIINAIVVEQKRQIAVMKSFGATAWGNMMMYGGIAFVYGLIAVIPGVILGVFAGYAITVATAPIVPMPIYIEGFSVSTSAVMLGIGMGLLVPLIAAFIPVMNGIRVNILDAMTDLGISSDYGSGPIARLIKNVPLPGVVKQALSNVNRKKGRLALTGLTLTMAAASFMGVMGMVLFLQGRIDELFNLDSTGYSISITSNQPLRVDDVSPYILDVEGVAGVYGEFEGSLAVEGFADDFGGNALPVRGVNPADGLFTIELLEGEGWTNDVNRNGIVLSEGAATELGLSAGDTLEYAISGETFQLEVIGIRENVPSLMRWDTQAIQSGFVDANGEPLPNAIRVALENADATALETADAINEMRSNLLDAGINVSYVNIIQQIEEGGQLIIALGGIFGMTAVVIAAIGAIGLLAALSMAVFERQKEIGVMRSIGAKSSTIVSQFLVEGITVSIIAWIVAVPLAFMFAQALVDIIAGEIGTFSFPPASMFIGLIGILCIALIASIGPSLGAARKTVSEILRYQ